MRLWNYLLFVWDQPLFSLLICYMELHPAQHLVGPRVLLQENQPQVPPAQIHWCDWLPIVWMPQKTLEYLTGTCVLALSWLLCLYTGLEVRTLSSFRGCCTKTHSIFSIQSDLPGISCKARAPFGCFQANTAPVVAFNHPQLGCVTGRPHAGNTWQSGSMATQVCRYDTIGQENIEKNWLQL